MSGYLKICLLGVILLVICQEAAAFKGKKDHKKVKELKNRGKYGDSFIEEAKTRPEKYYHTQYQQNSRRPIRSVRDAKMRVTLEEPAEEKVQYTHAKGKNSLKAQVDESLLSKRFENTCGKKYECGAGEKRKQKMSHLTVDEGKGKVSGEKKGSKVKHLYLNVERAEAEEESVPEDVEQVVRSKRVQRGRKIPAFLVLEDSAVDLLNGEQEIKYSTKSLRNLTPKFIIESENDIDLENATGHHYSSSSEDTIEESYADLNDTEDEYEEDFV